MLSLRNCVFGLVLVLFVAFLCWCHTADELASGKLRLRNSDFPRTYIAEIKVDLSGPDHWVTLKWEGPRADQQLIGPFRSCPGRGTAGADCNDEAISNMVNSCCTPKGQRFVEGTDWSLPSIDEAEFATWIDRNRGIAFHASDEIAATPSSSGCVRLDLVAAQLIHNNVKSGVTLISIGGDWEI